MSKVENFFKFTLMLIAINVSSVRADSVAGEVVPSENKISQEKYGFYTKNEEIRQYIDGHYGNTANKISRSENPLTDYEMILPKGAQPKISKIEKFVLSAHLDHPEDVVLVNFLLHLHLKKIVSSYSGYRYSVLTRKAKRLKHRIIAKYFAERALNLGQNDRRYKLIIRSNDRKLARMLGRIPGVDTSEGATAHKQFLDAFNYNEIRRYESNDLLMNHLASNPNNVMSAFLATASSLWIGGEAEYDDPTILYDYLVGSYLSLHTMKLAETAEKLWLENPEGHERFRLASIIGGFSVSMRRWIADLNGDQAAIAMLDEEHDEWLEINPMFHMFTYGLTIFEDDFGRAYAGWLGGFLPCVGELANQNFRTCIDRPRFSFNRTSIVLGTADMALKAGDTDFAAGLLNARYAPWAHFDEWDLGREAWLHREANFTEIASLYQNDDPTDDPLPLNLKRRKWSAPTMTCQSCHQAQDRFWSEEEQETILLHPEDILTIGEFPAVRTSWYGSL